MVAPELASTPGAILGRGAGRGGKRRAGRELPGLFKKPKNFPLIQRPRTGTEAAAARSRRGSAVAAAGGDLGSSLTPTWRSAVRGRGTATASGRLWGMAARPQLCPRTEGRRLRTAHPG